MDGESANMDDVGIATARRARAGAAPGGRARSTGSPDGGAFLSRFLWAVVACSAGYLAYYTALHPGIDFPAVWSGAHSVVHGISPYPTTSDPTRYFATNTPYFVHPPANPVLLLPLGVLPYKVAAALFAVASIFLLPIGLVGLLRVRGIGLANPVTPGILFLLVTSSPYRNEVALGNVDLLCAGLLAAGVCLLLSRPALLGCVLVGAAVALKPTVWPVILIVAAIANFARLVQAALFAIAVTAIGFVVVPGSSRFVHYAVPYLAHGQTEANSVRAALGDVLRQAGMSSSVIFDITNALLFVVIAGLVVIVVRRGDELSIGVVLLALTVAPLLFATYSFPVYGVYLFAAIPLLPIPSGWIRSWLAGFAAYLILSTDIFHSNNQSINDLLRWHAFVGYLILFGLLVGTMFEAGPPDVDPALRVARPPAG